MLSTKVEAAGQICPHFPELLPRLGHFQCKADGCAQWRWFDPLRDRQPTWSADGKQPDAPEGEGWKTRGKAHRSALSGELRQWWERIDPDRRGYCGLAGKPIDHEEMTKRIREERELGMRP